MGSDESPKKSKHQMTFTNQEYIKPSQNTIPKENQNNKSQDNQNTTPKGNQNTTPNKNQYITSKENQNIVNNNLIKQIFMKINIITKKKLLMIINFI